MKYIEIYNTVALDKFFRRFLRDGLEVLTKAMFEFFNMSLYQRIFLNTCEVVKQLKPINEKEKTDRLNYGSTSLLPIISKIIDKIGYDENKCFSFRK